MECAIITTYRCNARCKMCNTWDNPSKESEEFDPEILRKIPGNMVRLNVTGGEPTMRDDIIDILEILNTKTKRLELSTNGCFTEKIIDIAKKFPKITIRISVEGFSDLNYELRGIKNGFENALKTILELKNMGIKDIGFAIVISDKNIHELGKLNQLSQELDVEFSQSTLHNSFYFHKNDNKLENIEFLEKKMKDFIQELLLSKRKNIRLKVKDWFRAYINAGLLKYMKGEQRAIPCYAGSDSFFIDPYSKVLACNGSERPWIMGDLGKQSFTEIWEGPEAEKIRKLVKECTRGCWMAGSSVPAMRKNIMKPVVWVLKNKINSLLGMDIDEKI
ncbi:radical SAM protein [Spirochaetota bacterium]